MLDVCVKYTIATSVIASVQQNHIARIQALLMAGVLPVTDLHILEVRHDPGCPSWISARNLECWCRPTVWVAGIEVMEKSA